MPDSSADGIIGRMNARSQITLDEATQKRARARAAELGVSFTEYVRRLIADDLGVLVPSADASAVFDLVDDGPVTDVARNKDKMVRGAMLRARIDAPSKRRASRRGAG